MKLYNSALFIIFISFCVQVINLFHSMLFKTPLNMEVLFFSLVAVAIAGIIMMFKILKD